MPVLVPFVPALFHRFPQTAKVILCCEWPLYDHLSEAKAEGEGIAQNGGAQTLSGNASPPAAL